MDVLADEGEGAQHTVVDVEPGPDGAGCHHLQLIAAVRTVARGDALLSPAVTKGVIRQFTRVPRPAPPRELDDLTERELDVLRLLARGLSNAEIGRELYIGDTTVKTHITHILQKLGLRDRVQAVVLVHETGLFDGDTQPPGAHDEPVR